MSVPPSAIVEMPLAATSASGGERRGFFAWLRRLFLGTPSVGTPQDFIHDAALASAAAISDADPEAVKAAVATYVTAPGGYRIRVPQKDDVRSELNEMIADVRDGLSLIPPLPHVVVELLREIQNPSATAASVGAIAATDPAMSASLIRTVNSAAFALHRKITSVADAVNYLGFASVKAMVLHLQLEQILGKGNAAGPDLQDLWVHSMMVSHIADALAKQVSGVDRGFVTTLGLLHDIGKVVVLTRFSKEVNAMREARGADASISCLANERNVLGVDHADLGANVAAKWGLPADLVRAIRFHHLPQKAFDPSDPKPLHQAMYIVQIANQLAKYCYVYADEMEIDMVDRFALEECGFNPEVTALLEDKSVRAAASRAIFFAQEGATTPSKSVRRFLQLHRGDSAAQLVEALPPANEAPPLPILVDDDLCDSLFATEADRNGQTSRRFRATGAASESGLATLVADAKRQLAKLDLPNEIKLPLSLVARCMLANVPHQPKVEVEITHAMEGSQVKFAIRADGISFINRFGSDVGNDAAAQVLASELANVLNLKWFDSIVTSSDGRTLVFTTETH